MFLCAIILLRERERERERESWLLYVNCVVAVCVSCLFLVVLSVGLWSVAFLGHNHMLYEAFPLLQQHLGLTWTVHSCADPESFVRGWGGKFDNDFIFLYLICLLNAKLRHTSAASEIFTLH